MPDWPNGDAPRRGLKYINPDEALSPRQVEQLLGELYNEQIRAEVARRDLNDHLLDCVVAHEKALVIATMDPMCPKVQTTPRVTVDERDAWIKGVVFGEWEALQMAKTNLENQDRYLRALADNTSKVQTISGHVKQAYSLPGTTVGGR
jgi:hypothetical protein